VTHRAWGYLNNHAYEPMVGVLQSLQRVGVLDYPISITAKTDIPSRDFDLGRNYGSSITDRSY
jgi:hypothetical protein